MIQADGGHLCRQENSRHIRSKTKNCTLSLKIVSKSMFSDSQGDAAIMLPFQGKNPHTLKAVPNPLRVKTRGTSPQ
jgi:hypothetical protein